MKEQVFQPIFPLSDDATTFVLASSTYENETKEKAEMGDERGNLNKIILLIINTTFDAFINFWSL